MDTPPFRCPPAPAPAPLPLPAPRPSPPRQETTEISYTAYSPSPSSLEAYRNRMTRVDQWKRDVPNKHKRTRELGAGEGHATSSLTFGRGVGVGSAIWSEDSLDTGTVPTTIKEEMKERARTRRDGLEGRTRVHQDELRRMETVMTPRRTNGDLARQDAWLAPVRSSRSRTTVPVLALGSTGSRRDLSESGPARAAPTPLLANPPSQPSQKSRARTPPPATPPLPPVPGDLVHPPPDLHSTRSQREAYLASALDLPLELLSQVDQAPPLVPPPPPLSSSQLTTSRLGSLLGRARKDGQRSASAGSKSATRTAVPGEQAVGSGTGSGRREGTGSVKARSREGAERIVDVGGQAGLSRSWTVGPMRDTHKMAGPPDRTASSAMARVADQHGSEAPPRPVPRLDAQLPVPPSRSSGQPGQVAPERSPLPELSNTTLKRAAARPLPSSTAPDPPPNEASPVSVIPLEQAVSSAQKVEDGSLSRAVVRPSLAVKDLRDRDELFPTCDADARKAPIMLDDPLVPSEATIDRARRTRLPPTTTSAESPVKYGSQVKREDLGPPLALDADPRDPPKTWSRTESGNHLPPRPFLPHPANVPLPPSALTVHVGVPISAEQDPAFTHRQARALPRPALTRSISSFDGLKRALGRKPSTGNLHTRFEPQMYPLPSSKDGSSPTSPGVPPPPAPSLVGSSLTLAPPVGSGAAPTGRRSPAAGIRAPSPVRVPPPVPPKADRSHPTTYEQGSHRPDPPVGQADLQIAPSSRQPSSRDPNGNVSARRPDHPAGMPPHNVYFAPASTDRADENHVSFEVPHGRRGRLRVSLAWLRDRPRSSRRPGAPETADSPAAPPVPVKSPPSLVNRIKEHMSHRGQDEKNEFRKAPPPGSHSANYDRQSQRSQWNNPYYSGVTLPAYAQAPPLVSQIHQVQMRPLANRWAHPQPALPLSPTAYNPWTALHQLQANGGPPNELAPSRPPLSSPRPPSIEPPSEPDSPSARPLPLPLPGHAADMQGLPRLYQNHFDPRGSWAQSKPSFWERLFGNDKSRRRDGYWRDGGRENGTIRAWQRSVPPGRAPTIVPAVVRNTRPTNPYLQGGIDTLNGRPRPTPLRRKESAFERLFFQRRTEEGWYGQRKRRPSTPARPLAMSAMGGGMTGGFDTRTTAMNGFINGFGPGLASTQERAGLGHLEEARRKRATEKEEKERVKAEKRRAKAERRDQRQRRSAGIGQDARAGYAGGVGTRRGGEVAGTGVQGRAGDAGRDAAEGRPLPARGRSQGMVADWVRKVAGGRRATLKVQQAGGTQSRENGNDATWRERFGVTKQNILKRDRNRRR